MTFSHDSLSELLNAAGAGWMLEVVIERAVRAADPLLARQPEIPTCSACGGARHSRAGRYTR